MDELVNKYRANFKHLRIISGVERLYKQVVIEAVTPDGRVLTSIVPQGDAQIIERTLRDWSPKS